MIGPTTTRRHRTPPRSANTEHPAIADAPEPNPDATLPTLRTGHTPEDILERLDHLARRGRLPGFQREPDERGFSVLVFGEPFDQTLTGRIGEPRGVGVRDITFTLCTRRRLPTIFFVIVALTIWPGVLLTDALIPGAWGWWPTWTWYLPLTILPLPFFIPRLWKKSRLGARKHADEQIARIAAALEADIMEP